MYFSKYNIFSPIKDSDDFYLVNLLTGSADIIDKAKAQEIVSGNYTDIEEYQAKGYLIDPHEEKKLFRDKYLSFTENRDADEVQVFYVPWYACNFGCSYCYQSGYENKFDIPGTEVVDAFFSHVSREFRNRKKYVTLFGGEPLLPGAAYKDHIKYFFNKAAGHNLDIAVVTNGYALAEYIDILKTVSVREVQVTLDGLGAAHNNRRPLKDGSPTFSKIVEGIDKALANSITVNLRVVVDKENIDGLADLARFAVEKGWTGNAGFKTQLGRNYELHYCQAGQEKLFSRLEFYEMLYALIKRDPVILEFHKPAFSISKYLFENGELPAPLFDACTGCKTEWAFDYTGAIYACTATVGKPGLSLGTFYPDFRLRSAEITEWEDRDVTSIAECKDCSMQLACGGGCAAVAYNKTGRLHSPDCRPVKELIGMGIASYFNKDIE